VPISAKDLVEKDYITLGPEETADRAARLMKERRHGFVIVSEKGRPLGIVTEWDFIEKVLGEGKDASRVRLSEMMSTHLVSIEAKATLDEVAQLMAQRGVRRVLVFEGDRLLGIVTARTILARLKEYVDKVSSQIARLQTPPM
jgi:CBS domain-containing protein